MTRTISSTFPASNVPVGKMSTPPKDADREWKAKMMPVDCRTASTTVT
jgi:hypothetical protein